MMSRFQSSGGQALYTATGAAQAQVVRYSRIWSTLSQIVMQEGARGLFKGLGPTLLGETWPWLSTVTRGKYPVLKFRIYPRFFSHFSPFLP